MAPVSARTKPSGRPRHATAAAPAGRPWRRAVARAALLTAGIAVSGVGVVLPSAHADTAPAESPETPEPPGAGGNAIAPQHGQAALRSASGQVGPGGTGAAAPQGGRTKPPPASSGAVGKGGRAAPQGSGAMPSGGSAGVVGPGGRVASRGSGAVSPGGSAGVVGPGGRAGPGLTVRGALRGASGLVDPGQALAGVPVVVARGGEGLLGGMAIKASVSSGLPGALRGSGLIRGVIRGVPAASSDVLKVLAREAGRGPNGSGSAGSGDGPKERVYVVVRSSSRLVVGARAERAVPGGVSGGRRQALVAGIGQPPQATAGGMAEDSAALGGPRAVRLDGLRSWLALGLTAALAALAGVAAMGRRQAVDSTPIRRS